MASKHRKQTQRMKRIALVGAASATATCLTVGAAPPPPPHHATSTAPVALAAATGPDYTALIASLSNSTNNILFASANFQNALGSLWNPIGSASGGLLPTFGATVSQQNLATLQGLIGTLADLLAAPNLSNIPGLPADALPQILSALVPGLAPVLNTVVPVTGVLTGALAGPLATVQSALTLLTNLDAILRPLGLPINGIPSLTDLLGLTGSLTQYQSNFNWPILGTSATTTIDNTFVQLPSLTLSQLVGNLLGTGTTPGIITLPDGTIGSGGLVGSLLGGLQGLLGVNVTGSLDTAIKGALGNLLTPLDGIGTPSITAWLPAASGNYTLPLGASAGFLATMPTLAIGPLNSLTGGLIPPGLIDPALIDLNSPTVVAIPIFAGGLTLPLGLASFATVGTPGVLFPTATGVTTIGGASVTALNLFGIPVFTNTNLQGANYFGTNGFDFSNGTNVATIFGLPVTYSLGAVNFGTTGFGFTGPSIFGIGLFPSFQVGTAPNQQSSDGLIGSTVLNTLFNTARLVPTQTTSITERLGIPDLGKVLSQSVLTPGYQAVVTPLATQYANFLNQNAGSWTSSAASGFEQLTAAIEKLSLGLPGATAPTVPDPAVQNNTQTQLAVTPPAAQKQQAALVQKPKAAATDPVAKDQDSSTTDPATSVQDQVKQARAKLKTDLAAANAKTKASEAKAKAGVQDSVNKATDSLNKIAKDGQDKIKKTAASTHTTTANDASKNANHAPKAPKTKKSKAA